MTLQEICDQVDWLVASESSADALRTLRLLSTWTAERLDDERALARMTADIFAVSS